MKFYMHWHPGAAAHYWCEVGRPHRVCFLRYLLAKLTGYLATRAPDDMSICEVHVLAQIKHGGAHPNSYRVQEIRKMYAAEEKNGGIMNTRAFGEAMARKRKGWKA